MYKGNMVFNTARMTEWSYSGICTHEHFVQALRPDIIVVDNDKKECIVGQTLW